MAVLPKSSSTQLFSNAYQLAGCAIRSLPLISKLSWAFFQHLFSGLRHLVLDTGAGYELRTNKTWAVLTMIGSVTATVLMWLFILTRG